MEIRVLCAAGRSAFFGGLWADPCPSVATNLIGTEFGMVINLCQPHFDAVNEVGLVDEPYLDVTTFERKTGRGQN